MNSIEKDCDEEYERCYKMLISCYHSGNASYEVLANVLQKNSLLAICENYCLEGYDPPTKKTVALGKLSA